MNLLPIKFKHLFASTLLFFISFLFLNQVTYADNNEREYAYLYFYTIDGEEIDELEKRVRIKSDGLSKEYEFKDPNEYRYLPQEGVDGEMIYSEFYDQVKGLYWEEETDDGDLGQYEAGAIERFTPGEHYFRVKSDNPALTGENLIDTPSSEHAYLYFYSADYEEIEELEKELTEEDEYTMPDPAEYTHIESGDDESELSGNGIYWACTDQDDERYLFEAGDKVKFKPGDYEFHVVTDDPVTIRFGYPIDVPTYFVVDKTPGELYVEIEAVPGETIQLKRGLGAILWGCDFEGWNEVNYEDDDKIFDGGESYRIMDNVDLSFYAVYEENDDWDMNAVDENTGLEPEESEEQLIVDVDAVNEAAGAGYGAYINSSGQLSRGGNTKINDKTDVKGIPGEIEEKDYLSSLKDPEADPNNPENYTKDKYGRDMEESDLPKEINNVLRQDDSAMYMDVYGNAFVYYSDLSREDNMSLALARLKEGKTDSWVINVDDWDTEIINRFEAIEFALLKGEYPQEGEDLFENLDPEVVNGETLIWKNSYISESAFKKLLPYKKIWGGWYDEYHDGLYEKYKGKSDGGITTVSSVKNNNSLLNKTINSLSSAFGNVTAYADDNEIGEANQLGARIIKSMNDTAKYASQFWNSVDTYIFGKYRFIGLNISDNEEENNERINNLKQIFDYLIQLGFTKEAAAGACGNLWQETHFNPADTNGTYYGIVQWGDDRATGLMNFAASKGTSWDDLGTQLDYLKYELEKSYYSKLNRVLKNLGHPGADFRTLTDPQLACDVWCVAVEGAVRTGDPKPDDASVGKYGYCQELLKRRDYTTAVYNAMMKTELSPDLDNGCYIPFNASNNKVPYIAQSRGRWAQTEFGNQSKNEPKFKSISGSGCSSASLSMVLSYLSGRYIYPDEIVAKIRENNNGRNPYYIYDEGADHNIIKYVPTLYGFTGTQIGPFDIDKYLKAGYPVIMLCHEGKFTDGGHFVVITGTDGNGGYFVNDPNSAHEDFSYNTYTLEDLIYDSDDQKWWVIQ